MAQFAYIAIRKASCAANLWTVEGNMPSFATSDKLAMLGMIVSETSAVGTIIDAQGWSLTKSRESLLGIVSIHVLA